MTATVQGKKLDLTASTVAELQQQVASAQGLRADRQAVFFKGKKLDPSDTLADAGVKNGDALTVTASRGKSAVADSKVVAAGLDVDDDVDNELDAMAPSAASAGLGGGSNGMMDAMFGGAQSKEVLEALDNPVKLEQSRQALLNHPMYKQMAAQVPGLAEAVNDPKKWKETMGQAREMMGKVAAGGKEAAEVRQAMEAGMKYFGGPGGGGGGGGMGGMGGLDALLGGGARKDGPASQLKGVDASQLSVALGFTIGAQVETLGLSLGDVLRGMVEGARGGQMPMDKADYDEQMSRLLAKAGVSAGEGAVAHKGTAAKKVRRACTCAVRHRAREPRRAACSRAATPLPCALPAASALRSERLELGESRDDIDMIET